MDPFTIAAMLGVSALKNASDADREKRDRWVSGIQESMSPWTRMHGEKVKSGDPLGTLLQGATTGMSLSQGAAQAGQQEALNNALIENLKAQKAMSAGGPNSQIVDFGGIPAQRQSGVWDRMYV